MLLGLIPFFAIYIHLCSLESSKDPFMGSLGDKPYLLTEVNYFTKIMLKYSSSELNHIHNDEAVLFNGKIGTYMKSCCLMEHRLFYSIHFCI